MSNFHPRRSAILACVVAAAVTSLGLCSGAAFAQPVEPAPAIKMPSLPVAAAPAAAQIPVDPTDVFFNPENSTPVPELELRLSKENFQKLRDDPRNYVAAVLVENGVEIGTVGVKLKGAAGSFRGVDDRPALTINTDKFEEKSKPGDKRDAKLRYHGLEKFHLNNSVQDETLLQEWVCAEVFRAAGYPAARVAHARVSINGRDLGMYVVKEGFDKAFLKRHFGEQAKDAALYDSGFLQDIDAALERDIGKGKDDHADLQRVFAACREGDPVKRRAEIDRLVDIESLLRFIAIERMLAHWDGYTQNRNNYRVYIPPAPGKMRLIPHGMDQVFGDPNFPLECDAAGVLAATVLRNAEWHSAYRAELARQAAAFDAAAIIRKLQVVQAHLQPALKKINPDYARRQSELTRDLFRRMRARGAAVRQQLAQPAPPVPLEPTPLAFTGDEAKIAGPWSEMAETEGAVHETARTGGVEWRRLACPSGSDPGSTEPVRTVASWRTTVMLPPGTYTLFADTVTEGVEAIPGEPWPGVGAGIRVSGGSRPVGLTGSGKRTAEFTFAVDATREVVLVLELRAVRGSVAFNADTVKLKRTPAVEREIIMQPVIRSETVTR